MDIPSQARKAAAPMLAAALLLAAFAPVGAQQSCAVEEVAAGLDAPLGIAVTPLGNIVFTESGSGQNGGRISIVTPSGAKRVLLSGLPSGTNDVGGTSGPAGVFMRGRTVYALIGIGDSILSAGPGMAVANPNPSSPIFSSLLAIHFSADVERSTLGFSMSLADQQTLALGQRVTLSNGGGDTIAIDLVANFPDTLPRPGFPPGIVQGSNPYGIAVGADQAYVTDGGRNLVFKVDMPTGTHSTLAAFPNIPNPFPFGPPSVEAVPTGIALSDGQLLVALFRGAPFPPGSSVIEAVDPVTGDHAPFITGLKTAIGVLPVNSRPGTEHLVLQYDSINGPFFGGPGLLLRYAAPGATPQEISDCLVAPTAMVLDANRGMLYLTEEGLLPGTGRVVSLPVNP